MKETKVYVDELPENCFECPFMTDNQEGYDGCFCKFLDERVKTKYRLKGCPLINIKTQDRELVKEVCEKIRKELDGDYNQYRLNHILNQIQKEFEDGK